MTTEIVVANRSGMAEAPDGSKHRLVRGRTLADARHPLAAAYPDLFSPYTIDLPYEGDEPSPAAANDGSERELEQRLDDATATAADYRQQLAAIVEVLHAHDALPPEDATTEPGWLARAVAKLFDSAPPGDAPAAPKVPEPAAMPRKRAARPRPATVPDAEK